MIKAAFFDIDGTLVSFRTHRMPASAKRALAEMRERGVLTIISSGRPSYYLAPCVRTGFDAYLTMSGALCFDDAGVFRSAPIDVADVRTVVDQIGEGLYDGLALLKDRGFVNANSPRVLAVGERANLVYDVEDMRVALDEPVYQFSAFLDRADEHLILGQTASIRAERWTELFCDLMPATGGKAAGVEAALERFGIAPDEAIAFGDGENDISMLQAVGTGVAMGNAWDSVKAVADYVTDDIDSDGLYNACRRFGVI